MNFFKSSLDREGFLRLVSKYDIGEPLKVCSLLKILHSLIKSYKRSDCSYFKADSETREDRVNKRKKRKTVSYGLLLSLNSWN